MRGLKKFVKLFGAAALTGVGVVSLAACGDDNGGKTVIHAETRGLPAPFIYTVEDEKDSIYKTSNGDLLAGYDIAVITEIFKLPAFENYELDLTVSTNTLVDAQQGVIDFAINNYSYNIERAKSFYYSYPYTKSRYTITTAAGTTVDSFEALAESGLTIYGSAGANTTNAIERWNEKRTDAQKKIKIDYSSIDFTVQLQEAIEGKTALIHDQPVILSYKNSYPEQFKSLNISVLSDTETATNITANNTSHLLIGKTAPNATKYRDLLSEGIKTLYDNGKLAELGKKWVADVLGDSSVSVLPLASDLIYLN